MPHFIRVSHQTDQMLQALAVNAFDHTGSRRVDGGWDLPVSDETFERLNGHRFAGESDDDLIQWLFLTSRGKH